MPVPDKSQGGIGAPATHGFPIVNDVDFDAVSRAIYVGGAGDITAVLVGGNTVQLKAVPVGMMLAIRATKVTSSGTSATLLVALY